LRLSGRCCQRPQAAFTPRNNSPPPFPLPPSPTLNSPNYLNFQDWPGRKRKVATWIIGMWATGVGIPCFAIWWQNQKLKG